MACPLVIRWTGRGAGIEALVAFALPTIQRAGIRLCPQSFAGSCLDAIDPFPVVFPAHRVQPPVGDDRRTSAEPQGVGPQRFAGGPCSAVESRVFMHNPAAGGASPVGPVVAAGGGRTAEGHCQGRDGANGGIAE